MEKLWAMERYLELMEELAVTFEMLVELRNTIEQIKGVGGETEAMEVDWDLRYMQYTWSKESVTQMGKELGL